MCAIVDINVVHQGLGRDRTEAGKFFFDWLLNGGILVVGGSKFEAEIRNDSRFLRFVNERRQSGKVRQGINRAEVDAEQNRLIGLKICDSDDEHILALARVSDTRILFTNDGDLQKDFNDGNIIDDPRGQVYTTLVNKDVRRVHRNILSARNVRQICRHCRNRR